MEQQISQRIRDHVQKVESENQELKRRMQGYDEIKAVMLKLGIDPNGDRWSAIHALHEEVGVPLADAAGQMADQLKKFEEKMRFAANQRRKDETKSSNETT